MSVDNPLVQTTTDEKAKACERFTPKAERSVMCRTCNRPFFAHNPKARKFDSVFEMHRAYLTDREVLKWLFSVGKTLEEQLDIVEDILHTGTEVVNAPDLMALEAIRGILTQMIIEKDKKSGASRCILCKSPLDEDEERICFDCQSMVADGQGADLEACVVEVQDVCLAGADDAQVQEGSCLPPCAFD